MLVGVAALIFSCIFGGQGLMPEVIVYHPFI